MSSRQVCVFIVTTDAHYREFFGADNSFFSKKQSTAQLSFNKVCFEVFSS
ncbi:hypothetical protein XNW1_400017 [Xenorhabdus nematophila str. Websteri]|nr:hypothetical protein XNW1_3150018 [Xenorhabdus nematophila str. Websteri]CEF31766.1 hypothetical protein XNW1_400017 [Xenorhabdus nematophila str. Websteri]